VSWNAAFQEDLRLALEPVETEFRTLPIQLRETGRLLRANLAAAGAGDLTGVFSGPDDDPALFLHLWVLDGLALPPADPRTDLTRAAFFSQRYCGVSWATILES
jgi:hypothetical protein